MNTKERIKIRIEEWKDKKENYKFGFNMVSVYFLSLIVFVGTISITVISSMDNLILKSFIGFIFILFVFLLGYFFRRSLDLRSKKLDYLAKEMKKEYSKLKKT